MKDLIFGFAGAITFVIIAQGLFNISDSFEVWNAGITGAILFILIGKPGAL